MPYHNGTHYTEEEFEEHLRDDGTHRDYSRVPKQSELKIKCYCDITYVCDYHKKNRQEFWLGQ
jgi:hypothetical protein